MTFQGTYDQLGNGDALVPVKRLQVACGTLDALIPPSQSYAQALALLHAVRAITPGAARAFKWPGWTGRILDCREERPPN